MIFAGDFAQLAPVTGTPLYSRSVGTQKKFKTSLKDQEEAIGMALWHLTTVVVMLTKNMRQKAQTPDDDQLRKTLENMRYKSCTDVDIAYLKMRVAGRGLNSPKLAQKECRNVPVITAHNLQKDHINLMGAHRFARETGQQITSFYLVDSFRGGTTQDMTLKAARARNKKVVDGKHFSNCIPPEQQEIIWSLEPKYTNHKAGRLDLCVVTECCMTNSANTVVVGWSADGDLANRPTLNTLFVELLEGLPLNVVPLVKRSDPVEVVLLNGNHLCITRKQVPVLSQGQNRDRNPVDLQNCATYRGFYVALSRSTMSDGLIILSDFQKTHIRYKAAELEILSEITRLRHEGQLPDHINGHHRNTLIRQYQLWKGQYRSGYKSDY
ncbi:hypothetical protein FIBSPDRAFT_915371 [Athelia psychrophila]|uniref:ATP-dependent DNA helicase n=1 Tax=Athelia psychrophila TaxID=1759441 RepID=A0A167TNR5_9AGAM|nr:hypothetical protein FIBSPDRAFT_915371 [Fibularhizoctonia sp. CBS 109695]